MFLCSVPIQVFIFLFYIFYILFDCPAKVLPSELSHIWFKTTNQSVSLLGVYTEIKSLIIVMLRKIMHFSSMNQESVD